MRTVGAGGHVVGHVVSRVRGGFRHDGVVVSRPPCSVGFAVMGVSLFAVASLSLIRESLPTRWRILATFSFRIESSTMTTKCSASLAANGGVVTSRALSLAALGVANFRRRVNLFAWWRILATFSSRMCIRDARSHVRSYVHSHVHSHAHSRRAFSFWIALFTVLGGGTTRQCGVIKGDPAFVVGTLSVLCNALLASSVFTRLFAFLDCESLLVSMRHVFPAWRSTIIFNHLSSLATHVLKRDVYENGLCWDGSMISITGKTYE